MCYELAGGKLFSCPLECGPANMGASIASDETSETMQYLHKIVPELSQEASVFRPTWVKYHGIKYQCNNAYLIVGSDGLDPLFGHLNDILVVGGDMVIFDTLLCKVLYFDSHFHAYVIFITSQRSLFSTLLDHNVYHGHRLDDGSTYITLKYHILL
jgi:hypothetical protein